MPEVLSYRDQSTDLHCKSMIGPGFYMSQERVNKIVFETLWKDYLI